MNIFKSIRIKRMNNEKYIDYLRTTGLQIGSDCEVYKSASFGSEPYLIRIGNHVRINANVTFVTHDGGFGCCVKNMKIQT